MRKRKGERENERKGAGGADRGRLPEAGPAALSDVRRERERGRKRKRESAREGETEREGEGE